MTYRHPQSYRPPLAYGGHMWRLIDPAPPGWMPTAQCVRCGVTVPRFVVQAWRRSLAWTPCPAKVLAIGPAPRA